MNTEKHSDQREDPYGFWILAAPILAMGVLIGFIALLMRSTGKW